MRYSKVAGGNITPSSIVILDSSNPGQVLLASSATATPFWGVSAPPQRNIPWNIGGVAVQDGYAAVAGETIWIYGDNDPGEIWLKLGGTVTAGDTLTSDGSGLGITTTTTLNYVIGQALIGGVSGDLIPIRLYSGGAIHR
jgi:hypothetical protein